VVAFTDSSSEDVAISSDEDEIVVTISDTDADCVLVEITDGASGAESLIFLYILEKLTADSELIFSFT
jgi:hypothetical protein